MPDYRVDGLMPSEVVSPTTKSDVASHLSELCRQGKTVVPWGGGTRMGIGNTPKGYDVALDLTSLASEIEHVAGDMTVVCDAGAKISDLSSFVGRISSEVAVRDTPIPVKQRSVVRWRPMLRVGWHHDLVAYETG